MKFNTLSYTSKDIGLQGNYKIIIANNEVFFKGFPLFSTKEDSITYE